MTRFRERITQVHSQPPRPTSADSRQSLKFPNVGVVISHTQQQLRIRDLDNQNRDILVQGDEMCKFIDELNAATRQMPDIPIKDALVILTATHVANHWS